MGGEQNASVTALVAGLRRINSLSGWSHLYELYSTPDLRVECIGHFSKTLHGRTIISTTTAVSTIHMAHRDIGATGPDTRVSHVGFL